ncbi:MULTISPECIES: hypothetical protein [Bacteroides]|uniref:hypothetical protein n=1 Tax=Bacteroides TaxID=816 RepID=UPI0023F910DC|nr:hypothetical protein [Bacteroides congonensis]
MKKYLAIISALFMLAACDKSSDQPEPEFKTVGLIDEIKISDIEAVSSAITEVAFVARFHGFNNQGFTFDADGKDTRVMLKVPFDAKCTTLVLPENPPQELLSNIALDFPEGFEISNPEAKTIAFVEIACNISAQNRFSDFLYMVSDSENVCYEQTYIYCDRSATITGTGEDWWGNRTVYNLNLQKGWNLVIEKKEQQNNSVTNLMPSGMKWKQSMWIGGR